MFLGIERRHVNGAGLALQVCTKIHG
jgi:hypothetical protein